MMFFPIIFPIFGAGGGGDGGPPRTKAGPLLAVIAIMVAVLIGAIAVYFRGWRGLLIPPAFFLIVAWVSTWGWLGAQCLEHTLRSKGVMAVATVAAAFICLAVALLSIMGGLFLLDIVP